MIEHYYGKQEIQYLQLCCRVNNPAKIYHRIQKIRFELPSHIFKIAEKPLGWSEFLMVSEYQLKEYKIEDYNY
jgi:hypothetical protein